MTDKRLEYLSEKLWIQDNIAYRPLSAAGYLGSVKRYSLANYIPDYEIMFCDYVKDNANNDTLLKFLGINESYTIEEFLNFKYRYNNFGFRDDVDYTPDNSENEIWCFGCSYTVGDGVPREKTWPALVQKETGLVVRNFAVSGGGMQTILRLLENWLKVSKHKPRYILIFGYFERRFEFESQSGEFLRIGLYGRYADYSNLPKADVLKIKENEKRFEQDPDSFIREYSDKIDNVLKEHNHITLNVHNYEIVDRQYTMARDVQFLKFVKEQHKLTKTKRLRKDYYQYADKFFDDVKYYNFGTSWVSHSGLDFHKDVANDFLRNLTI